MIHTKTHAFMSMSHPTYMYGTHIAMFWEAIVEDHGLNLGLNVRDQELSFGPKMVGDVERTHVLLLQTFIISTRLIVVRRLEIPILLRHSSHASYFDRVCHYISLK